MSATHQAEQGGGFAVRHRVRQTIRLNTELQQDADDMKVMLDGIAAGIFGIGEDGDIIYANKMAVEQFGYSKECLESMKVDNLVPRESRAPLHDLRREYSRNPKPRRMGENAKVYGIDSNGDRFPLEIGLAPITLNGQKITLVTAVDISERSFAEGREKVALQLLKEKNQELVDLSSVLAHDLKDPIGRIVSVVELLPTFIAQGQGDKVTEYLDMLTQTATHSFNLINSLYKYATVGHSAETELAPVSLRDAVAAALGNIAQHINGHEIINGLDRADFEVWSVKPLLIQVFQNLLANAVKYAAAGGGKIWIEVRAQDPDPRQGADLLIKVSDNGPGIFEDKARYIFEPYMRFSKAENQEGIGLGLATCKKMVAHFGGEIWYEPSAYGGASFCMTLKKA